MSKIIVIIGAPGAGKGTQSRLLSEKFGYPQISTGDILREMGRADTPLGLKVKETMAAGRLVSDEILAEVIRGRTSQSDCFNGYILDGYPRTLNQANQLEELASKQGNQVFLARIIVPEGVLFKRLTGRRACPVCGEIYNIYFRPPMVDGICDIEGAALAERSDDNPESVSKRFEEYRQSTAPLVDYYRQSGRLLEINGELPVNEIFDTLLSAIEGAKGHDSGASEDGRRKWPEKMKDDNS